MAKLDPFEESVFVSEILRNADNEEEIDKLKKENELLKQRLDKLEGKKVKKEQVQEQKESTWDKMTKPVPSKVRWWMYLIASSIPLIASIIMFIVLITKY